MLKRPNVLTIFIFRVADVLTFLKNNTAHHPAQGLREGPPRAEAAGGVRVRAGAALGLTEQS